MFLVSSILMWIFLIEICKLIKILTTTLVTNEEFYFSSFGSVSSCVLIKTNKNYCSQILFFVPFFYLDFSLIRPILIIYFFSCFSNLFLIAYVEF